MINQSPTPYEGWAAVYPLEGRMYVSGDVFVTRYQAINRAVWDMIGYCDDRSLRNAWRRLRRRGWRVVRVRIEAVKS